MTSVSLRAALIGRAVLLSAIAAIAFATTTAHAGEAVNVKTTPMVESEAAGSTAQFNLIKAVQRKLLEAGHDAGPADGLKGPRTTAALKAYQAQHGLSADGILGPMTLSSLGLQ